MCQPNKLKRESKKKMGGKTEGQAKNWGAIDHPAPP